MQFFDLSAARGKLRRWTGRMDTPATGAPPSMVAADSDRDPVTGLGGASAFRARLAELLAAAHDGAPSTTVLRFDIDGFAQARRAAGDDACRRILETFAAELSAGLRYGDSAYRVGEAEFVLVLRGLPAGPAAQCIGQLISGRVASEFDAADWHSGCTVRAELVAQCATGQHFQ